MGGAATATSNATGKQVNSNANAVAGAGQGGPNTALATAIANGATGLADAKATTALVAPVHPSTIIADANMFVSGGASLTAETTGFTAPAFITPAAGVATGSVAPNAASANPVVATNPNIAGKIGASPTFLAMGELGGGYATGAAGATNYTTSIELKVGLAAADLSNDLVVSFYNPTRMGVGVSDMSLEIRANSITVPSGGSFADEVAFFTDHPIDCGTLATMAPSNGMLDLTVTIKESLASPGDGFYVGYLVTG